MKIEQKSWAESWVWSPKWRAIILDRSRLLPNMRAMKVLLKCDMVLPAVSLVEAFCNFQHHASETCFLLTDHFLPGGKVDIEQVGAPAHVALSRWALPQCNKVNYLWEEEFIITPHTEAQKSVSAWQPSKHPLDGLIKHWLSAGCSETPWSSCFVFRVGTPRKTSITFLGMKWSKTGEVAKEDSPRNSSLLRKGRVCMYMSRWA